MSENVHVVVPTQVTEENLVGALLSGSSSPVAQQPDIIEQPRSLFPEPSVIERPIPIEEPVLILTPVLLESPASEVPAKKEILPQANIIENVSVVSTPLSPLVLPSTNVSLEKDDDPTYIQENA